MRMAGAEDRDKYRSGLARTKKSTSTSKMSWALKTSRRISVPTTDSTWPISRSREMPIFVWYGAARFRKLNSTCATVESITLVRLATSPARGGPQPACTFGIRTAICGNLSSTSNRIMRKERHSWNIGDSDLLRCLLLASGTRRNAARQPIARHHKLCPRMPIRDDPKCVLKSYFPHILQKLVRRTVGVGAGAVDRPLAGAARESPFG